MEASRLLVKDYWKTCDATFLREECFSNEACQNRFVLMGKHSQSFLSEQAIPLYSAHNRISMTYSIIFMDICSTIGYHLVLSSMKSKMKCRIQQSGISYGMELWHTSANLSLLYVASFSLSFGHTTAAVLRSTQTNVARRSTSVDAALEVHHTWMS